MTAIRLPGLPRFLRSLASDERGVSVIEMAFLAPILAAFTAGIGDLGTAFAQRFALQQAVHRTLEMAHQAGPIGGTYNYLAAEAATAASVPVADVTVTQWAECDGVDAGSFTATCTAAQEMSRFVRLQISCTYSPMFSGMPFTNRNTDGSVPLNAVATMRVQ